MKSEQFPSGKSKDTVVQGMTGGELSSHILLEDMGEIERPETLSLLLKADDPVQAARTYAELDMCGRQQIHDHKIEMMEVGSSLYVFYIMQNTISIM